MSQVDFEESRNNSFSYSYQNQESKGLIGLLIKWGIVNDAKTANLVLLGMAVLFFSISIYLAYAFLIPPKAPVVNGFDTTNPLRDRINQP
jgi:hypothetical protein